MKISLQNRKFFVSLLSERNNIANKLKLNIMNNTATKSEAKILPISDAAIIAYIQGVIASKKSIMDSMMKMLQSGALTKPEFKSVYSDYLKVAADWMELTRGLAPHLNS